jgi:hypothetical protein
VILLIILIYSASYLHKNSLDRYNQTKQLPSGEKSIAISLQVFKYSLHLSQDISELRSPLQIHKMITHVVGGRGNDSAQGVLLPLSPSHHHFPSYCVAAPARRYFSSTIHVLANNSVTLPRRSRNICPFLHHSKTEYE